MFPKVENLISRSVHQFYEELPFNYRDSVEESVQGVLKRNSISYYSNLEELFSKPLVETVLDIGCGAGWFSNMATYYYNARVTGIDLSEKSLERAKAVAEGLNLNKRVEFKKADLFSYYDNRKYDLVNSLGVLHCTHDCKKAFMVISQYVNEGKYIHIGLYHYFGRKVALEYFRKMLADNGEEFTYERFKEMNPQLKNETHLQSWFRDQVLHPHETLHTFREVEQWFRETGFQMVSTSINHFKPIKNLDEIVKLEEEYTEFSYRRNIVEKRFFPGFFTVLGQKKTE